MPSLRMRLHDAHQPHDRRRRPSGCRRRAAASGRSRCPSVSQKSRTLPALKPVLLGAAAVDDARRDRGSARLPGGDAPPPRRRRRRDRWCRSGRNRLKRAALAGRVDARLHRLAAAGWPAPGSSLRTRHEDGGRACRSGIGRRPRRQRARPRRQPSARPCSSHRPIDGVPEAEHGPGRADERSRRTGRRRRSSSRRRRATGAIAAGKAT